MKEEKLNDLIKQAERRYSLGTVYKPIRANCERVSSGKFVISNGALHESNHNGESLILDNNLYALVFDGDAWAEVVSQPNEAMFTDNDWKEMGEKFNSAFKGTNSAGQVMPLQNPSEPKAGDMVEATDLYEFNGHEFECIFTGGHHSDGRPIIESKGCVYPVKFIRLPQKSEVKAKVKLFLSTIEFEDDTLKDLCECAVENGIKWGQANSGKI